MLPPRRFCPQKIATGSGEVRAGWEVGGVLLSGQGSYERSPTRGLAGDGALAGHRVPQEESLMKRMLVTCHTPHDGWRERPGLGELQ